MQLLLIDLIMRKLISELLITMLDLKIHKLTETLLYMLDLIADYFTRYVQKIILTVRAVKRHGHFYHHLLLGNYLF